MAVEKKASLAARFIPQGELPVDMRNILYGFDDLFPEPDDVEVVLGTFYGKLDSIVQRINRISSTRNKTQSNV